jgi:hypothetical protein
MKELEHDGSGEMRNELAREGRHLMQISLPQIFLA